MRWLGAELFVLLLPLCILYFQDESNKERITFNDEYQARWTYNMELLSAGIFIFKLD